MTIRVRLICWYGGLMLVSLLLMLGVLYYELVVESRLATTPEPTGEQIVEIILFYGVPTAALFTLGGWWLLRQFLAPITALTRVAERVHAGNLRERLPRSGNGDELDRLTGIFNDMLGRLEDAFARVHEFTLHASHELKTPLTILRGEIETALRDGTLGTAQREFFESQLDEIQRLARIVDDLTLLAKADAGLVPMRSEPVRVEELLREAWADARILAQKEGLEVSMDACEAAMVRGDPHRLRQLLLNLTDNALRYNVPGGRVGMACRAQHDRVIVEIRNTGTGVAQEHRARVFDRFFRGPHAQVQHPEGTGLGLSIARWIVEAHDGAIELVSSSGGVTSVVVTLPRDREQQ